MQVKYDLLNWRPDAEDVGNQGLTTCDNVLHQPEGYIPAEEVTGGAFATEPGLGGITTVSLMVKPFGALRTPDLDNNLVYAQIRGDTLNSLTFGIGVVGEGDFTSIAMSTVTSYSLTGIKSISVSEIGQTVSIHAEAQTTIDLGKTIYSLGGYFTYTVTSL